MSATLAALVALLFPPLFAKAILAAVVLLMADALFGMAVAIKGRTFDIHRVADYLSQDNAVKILGWILLTEVAAMADYANVGLDFGSSGLSTFIGASAAVTVLGPLFAEFVLKVLKVFGVVQLHAQLAMRAATRKPRRRPATPVDEQSVHPTSFPPVPGA